ncbi:Agmatine coumaroyltransferase-2 [Ananas comosus]|uniref:Agmatine coumaroyltransferase-2 n=1 Tax=Ananas comosus TaxID=4615 RepID=A0A199VMP2_ANACO|nr:Agmatine coumaroyltransferase-2 [Ananas comosus]
MNVRVVSTKIIKPVHDHNSPQPIARSITSITLSAFDRVSEDMHIAAIYAFRPPAPSNSAVATGLARVLSHYPEWAGWLGHDENNNPAILLNDKGVKLTEASVDSTFDEAVPLDLSPVHLSLQPSKHGIEELLQVQLTRFACGALVVGYTMHHRVADGHAASQFLVAWGRACRGLEVHRHSSLDRCSLFSPRNPPHVDFEHRGVEFASEEFARCLDYSFKGKIITYKAHFTKEFLKKLKSQATSGAPPRRSYTTVESLVAHLWRAVTIARGLDKNDTTNVRISVNGRTRLRRNVPDDYFGNLILWAYPRTTVKELVSRPLHYVAELIHRAVADVDERYFKSFVDFASSGAVEAEGLVPAPEPKGRDMCRNLDVDSWIRFPLYELDFGGGSPFYFMPSYMPVEGLVNFLPSLVGDGRIEVHVSLFDHNVAAFQQLCYSLDADTRNYGYNHNWDQVDKVKEMARL